ncbi:hypothetical protein [Planktotalea sp.]|uniref:hypothetical protein n=1 Tax=Planktotalea sp. TaxID=2029877 RepID=UPI003297C369
MTNAKKICDDANLDFEEIFAYQYLVTPGSAKVKGLTTLPFGRYSVHIGSKLHSAMLLDRKGRFFGYVFGVAVDKTGLITNDHIVEELDLDDPRLFTQFAEYLNDVAGRYVVLCGASDEHRIYTDPVAMIGCVYDPLKHRVASSLNLVLDRDLVPNPITDDEAILERGGKYTLFHTQDAHVKRLNGSFFLDLDTMIETRFWPRTEKFEVPVEAYGGVYDEIIATGRHIIGSITGAFKTAMPISGGRDSRLLAGLAGEHVKEVNQPFTHITNFATRYDAAVATLVGQHLDIPHEIHSWRQPAPPRRSRFKYRQDLRGFQTALGSKSPMPDEMTKNVHQFLGENQIVLRGHLTDLLRAVYVFTSNRRRWKVLDWQMQRLFPVQMSEFNKDIFANYLPDFVSWRRTLPPAALEMPLDFMFLEVYYNSTVGYTFNGLHRQFYMSPYNSRRLIELSLAINVDYRRTMKPVDDILYRIDPELCAIPYYKEAGSDLSVIAPDQPWHAISDARMAEVKARFDSDYSQAHEIIAQSEPDTSTPLLSSLA